MIPNRMRVELLKQQLARTDYKALKYAEGLISDEDYAPIKAQRQQIREQIDALEAQPEGEETDA